MRFGGKGAEAREETRIPLTCLSVYLAVITRYYHGIAYEKVLVNGTAYYKWITSYVRNYYSVYVHLSACNISHLKLPFITYVFRHCT